jgi:ATP synthase protein I
MDEKRGPRIPFLNPAYLRYGSLGLEMGVAIAIGLLIGLWLDKRFDTKPWLTILFLLFGLAAGFKNVIRIIREEERKGEGDGRDS